MKRHLAGGLVLALSLAGLAHAGGLPARAPGLWWSSTSVMGPDGAPMPQAQNVVVLSCVDAATDQKFLLSGSGACSQLKVSGAGGHYKIEGVCKQGGGQVRIDEALTYVGDKSVLLKAALKAPGGTVTMTSSLHWQGPCLPGMEPGDEGAMVDGRFSKSGNINDPLAP